MKIAIQPSVLVFALSLLAACTPKESTTKQVAADLHGYMGALQKWEPKEKEIFQAIDDVESSQYVDDDFVIRTLKSALPALDEHRHNASTFRPLTPEILDVHDHYRKGYDDVRSAVQRVIAAAEKKDYVALATAKSELKRARTDVLKSFRAMDILLEEHNAELQQMNKS